MAITRNPVQARLLMLKAWALRQRPADLANRLRRDVDDARRKAPITPEQAWAIYTHSARQPCFADNGWLVQYGVYKWTGSPQFHFSLVRQLNTLETWSDEYVQVELLLHTDPMPALASLDSWHAWSFEHSSPTAFFEACTKHTGVRQVLATHNLRWTVAIHAEET